MNFATIVGASLGALCYWFLSKYSVSQGEYAEEEVWAAGSNALRLQVARMTWLGDRANRLGWVGRWYGDALYRTLVSSTDYGTGAVWCRRRGVR